MPLSNDNQDYGEKDKKNEEAGNMNKPNSTSGGKTEETDMTTDNLKGKKVDADLDKSTDKPTDV